MLSRPFTEVPKIHLTHSSLCMQYIMTFVCIGETQIFVNILIIYKKRYIIHILK